MNTSKCVGDLRKLDRESPLGIRRHERSVRSLLDELALCGSVRPSGQRSCAARRRPPGSVSRPAPRRAMRIPDHPWAGAARFDGGGILGVGGCRVAGGADGAARRRRGGPRPRATNPRRGADRPLGIQQPANPAETGGSRIQPEDAERSVQTAAATIGMPQDPHERFSRLDRGRLAQRDREIVAGVFPKLMNDAIRNPDDRIEEVQDGGESLQRHDDQIAAPDMGQLVKQDPSQLVRRERRGDSARQDDRRPSDPPDRGRGDAIQLHDPDRVGNSGAATQLAQVDGQLRLIERETVLKPRAKPPLRGDQPSQEQQDAGQPGDHDHGRHRQTVAPRSRDQPEHSRRTRSAAGIGIPSGACLDRESATTGRDREPDSNCGASVSVPTAANRGSTGGWLVIRSGT